MGVSTPTSLEDEDIVVRSLRDLSALANSTTKNPIQSDITDLQQTQTTISGTYTQSEIDSLAADIKANADKLDIVLAALRSANILGG